VIEILLTVSTYLFRYFRCDLNPQRHVYQSMRRTLCILIVITASSNAQWRRFGARPAGSAPVLSRDILAAHNVARARVDVPPLVWSARLAAIAQDWANTLLARRQFQHRPHPRYGENLFEVDGASVSPAEVVSDWMSESRGYNYNSNKCHGVCGHYTQIVWRDTKEVGCAIARGEGREIWVCNYDPPGNWVGRRPY
jgi:pathogenesis-related protein 1